MPKNASLCTHVCCIRNINHVDTGSKRPVSWLKAVPTADQLCLFSVHQCSIECSVVLYRSSPRFGQGGADGCITEWKVSGKKIARVRVTRIGEQDVPTIRAFDIHPTAPERRVIVGTAQCDRFEVSDGSSRLLIDGHMAPLFGCCAHPTDPNVFVTACESSRCFIFDAQRKFVSRTVGLPGLCRSVAISPDGQQLAVGLKDGQLCVMWFESLERVARTHLMKEAIDALKFSPDGQFLAVGSHDNYIDIYETRSYKRLSRCTGHSSYITHLDWSADSKLIRSTCGAYELLYWSMPKSVRVTAEQRDTVWATNTCVLGFSVMGIWPDYSDGTDVNAVDTDKQNSVVVTADDYGQVKLFNFPCVVDDAPHKLYKGHSSHVMCVRFLAGASRVKSVGGPDRAELPWRATNIRQPAAALPKPEVHARAVRDKTSAAKQAQIRIYRGDENKENRHLPKLASKGQPAGNPGCLGPQGGGGTRPGWWG
jgi:WD40 repeat protein